MLSAGVAFPGEFLPLSEGNWWRFQRWEGMMIFQDTITRSEKGKYEMLRVTDIDTDSIEVWRDSKGSLLFSWAQFKNFLMLPPNLRVGKSWLAYRWDSLADKDGDGIPDTLRRTVRAKVLAQENVEVPAGKFSGAFVVRYLTLDSTWLSSRSSWGADTAGDTLRYWVRGVGLVILEDRKIPDKFVLTNYGLR